LRERLRLAPGEPATGNDASRFLATATPWRSSLRASAAADVLLPPAFPFGLRNACGHAEHFKHSEHCLIPNDRHISPQSAFLSSIDPRSRFCFDSSNELIETAKTFARLAPCVLTFVWL
jgi:hypothetical protein